jgi:hypothetical protein
MSMFDKLVRKGGKLAGEYVRGQLAQRGQGDGVTGRPRTGEHRAAYPDRSAPPRPAFGVGEHDASPGRDLAGTSAAARVSPEDQAAVAKYRYMLRTAPPEDMERAHAEAFARLTPRQRALLQAELAEVLPESERPRTDRPDDMARAATRAEVSRPGFMEQLLGRGGAGRPGPGGAGGIAAGAVGGLGAGLLAGVAGAFIGTAVAGPLLEGFSGISEELGGAAEGLTDDVAGMGEELLGAGGEFLGAGEGVVEQAGGLFDGLRSAGEGIFGGGGGLFGDFSR